MEKKKAKDSSENAAMTTVAEIKDYISSGKTEEFSCKGRLLSKRSVFAQGKFILKLCVFDLKVDEAFFDLLEYCKQADPVDVEEISFTISIWCNEDDPVLMDLVPGKEILIRRISKFSIYRDRFLQEIASIKNISFI